MTGPCLAGAQIVCLAPNPWHDIWRNRQHIFSRLALRNTVLYVEPKIANLEELRRAGRAALGQPRLVREMENLWLYRHPVWAPGFNRPGLRSFARGLRWLALRRAMNHLDIHRPITWVYQPRDAELVGSLGERLIVAHVVDEYAAFQHYSESRRRAIRDGEARLLRRADLVIVTSKALLESKRAHNAHVVYVPNAVDFERFEQARLARRPPPADIARLPPPVIGYAGHISARLDLPLLAAIARRHPDWSLALVGSVWGKGCEAELDILRGLPNVHFLGAKPADQLPEYIHAFDAGLIPYRPGEEARNINPIKLYEYLAAGKPVVSLDLPALDGFQHVARTADTPEAFIAQLEAGLAQDTPEAAAERRRVAAGHTWDRRVELIEAAVAERLGQALADGAAGRAPVL